MKEQTLEEAAEFKSHHSEEDFIRGGRWQQEQDKNKYSEEEVGKLITEAIKRTAQYCNINKLYGDTIEQFSKEWFNENKKK